MTIELNVRSLVFGLLVGIMLMLALGATRDDSPRYDTAVACNDVWVIFTRVNTYTGKVTVHREAVSRIATVPQTLLPATGQ